jgi:hypothetical protein
MSKHWQATLFGAAMMTVTSCVAPTADNPYPGDGGSFFKHPTERNVADARLKFDAKKLSAFQPNVSTKREVVAALGEPTWWTTYDNGNSELGYDFLQPGSTVNSPAIAPAMFVFDSRNVLVDLNFAESYSKFQIERGPETYAYVEATVGESFFLGGIVPKAWVHDGEDSTYIGGYFRAPVRVERVIAGEVSRRRQVLEFTASAERIPGWTGYFLLATDTFGTTRVLTWSTEIECGLHNEGAPDRGLDGVIKAVRSSERCLH